MLDGRVLEASQVEKKPFRKPPLQREGVEALRLHQRLIVDHDELALAAGKPSRPSTRIPAPVSTAWRRRCSRPRCATPDGLRVNQDRPQQRGYNSFVPLEPMNQLQVDLADMKAFGGKPYPFMLVAINALTKKVAAEPLKDRLASTTAAGMKKVFQALGVPANVYSDDGSEFKREFSEWQAELSETL